MENALLSLGKSDLQQLMETEGKAEVHCEFCRHQYLFSKADLAGLLMRMA
jgi:molecular chaperone Hsp33